MWSFLAMVDSKAALEACVGGAFFPGIEVSWKVRDVFRYVEPFRLDPECLSPGDISQQMSLPWQTDFVDCAYEALGYNRPSRGSWYRS